jgi:hypothetical protein
LDHQYKQIQRTDKQPSKNRKVKQGILGDHPVKTLLGLDSTWIFYCYVENKQNSLKILINKISIYKEIELLDDKLKV